LPHIIWLKVKQRKANEARAEKKQQEKKARAERKRQEEMDLTPIRIHS